MAGSPEDASLEDASLEDASTEAERMGAAPVQACSRYAVRAWTRRASRRLR
nr:hypothetical protein [uncultured Acetatifactor sp.]